MQIERLIKIIFLLVGKPRVSAKELADHFNVSTRTIYRDIDTLSISGIPVYSERGNGGGIGIIGGYTIDKSLFSDDEQHNIIHGLQVLEAASYPGVEDVLSKITVLFKKKSTPWLDVDFSNWGSNRSDKAKFRSLDGAIINKRAIEVDYFNSDLERMRRCIEPLRMIFKSNTWYKGYCKVKGDIRIFRISRMRRIVVTDKTFTREAPETFDLDYDYNNSHHKQPFKLKFSPNIAHRIYDEFDDRYVERCPGGGFIVNCDFPVNDWFFSYLLSFADHLEVLEPDHIRLMLKEKAHAIADKY